MKLLWVATAALAVMLGGCTGGQPTAVVTVTASGGQEASPSPTFATPGTADDADFSEPTCSDLARGAMRMSRESAKGSGHPWIIAILRKDGPTIDHFGSLDKNTILLACEGTAVWNHTFPDERIEYGIQVKGGKYFTFYRPA